MVSKRKPLPPDQSKMYVYPQDNVDKWVKETEKEKHKKVMEEKSNRSQKKFDRLYIEGDETKSDFKENVQ